MKPIKLLIVDDSAVVRQVLTQVFAQSPDIRVIAAAPDPLFALEKMRSEWPDVIVLDVEMPRMDGITFLRKLMSERPTPVIICSTLTAAGTQTSIDALAAGALQIVTKPTMGLKQFLQESAHELIQAVRAAAGARLGALRPRPSASPAATPAAARPAAPLPAPLAAPAGAMAQTTDVLVAIGTSTGGTIALEQVLSTLPRACPGIVIVQHMPELFTAAFARRLDSLCQLDVREAKTNDRVLAGSALIAPGGKHMVVRRSGAQYRVEVLDGPPVNRHRPSVDVLFRSVAECAGRNALGILMTGMGADGARGLLQMHEAGARTLAQDEASCVVYGMPKEAVKLGAVDRTLALDAIPQEIVGALRH